MHTKRGVIVHCSKAFAINLYGIMRVRGFDSWSEANRLKRMSGVSILLISVNNDRLLGH